VKYDFIIAGGGCAGLSMLDRLLSDQNLSKKDILLVDKQDYQINDKTWCFWEKGTPWYASLVSKSWDHIHFADREGVISGLANPFRYHMIRSLDFYQHILTRLKNFPNVKLIKGWISEIGETDHSGYIVADGQKFEAQTVFNSFYGFEKQKPTFSLHQHFKGYFIQTAQPIFKGKGVYLMDFRIPQIEGPSFMYVLPTSDNEALVECTYFTENTFHQTVYHSQIKQYLEQIWNLKKYEIVEEEHGVIPMKDATFKEKVGSRIINLGAIAGAVKPTTGYAFKNIQRRCDFLINQLSPTKNRLTKLYNNKRFRFYDKLLLYLMTTEKEASSSIFSALFRKNSFPIILKFLDERSNLLEEILLFSTLPKIRFLKALTAVYFKNPSFPIISKPKSELR
jgi:lycopene beta-cyclase